MLKSGTKHSCRHVLKCSFGSGPGELFDPSLRVVPSVHSVMRSNAASAQAPKSSFIHPQ